MVLDRTAVDLLTNGSNSVAGVASRLIFRGTACETYPCWNDGECRMINDSLTDYECLCNPSFVGANCQYSIASLCLESGCAPWRSCVVHNVSFMCGRASDLLSSCASSECMNGGECVNGIHGHRCVCPTQFAGPLCQFPSRGNTDWNVFEIILVLVLFFLVLFIFTIACCSGNIGFYVSVPTKRYMRWEEGDISSDEDLALETIKRGSLRASSTAETLVHEEQQQQQQQSSSGLVDL